MKKILIILFAAAASVAFTACDQTNTNDAANQQAENQTLRDSIRTTLAYQDSLFALINEISDGMNQIKYLEKVANTNAAVGGETPSQKEQMKADIQSIQEELKVRREKIATLESKLAKSNNLNQTLQKTIENLKKEIEEQEETITSLRAQLDQANRQIARLDNKVDSLNTTVSTVRQEKAAVEEQNVAIANEMNTCYYVIGTSKELKKHKIVEGGFLRKTKIMQGDFDQSYFTTSDKRRLHTINLHSNKAKVLTNHPESSYEISENADGTKILNIRNTSQFWGRSNYLVVQVD